MENNGYQQKTSKVKKFPDKVLGKIFPQKCLSSFSFGQLLLSVERALCGFCTQWDSGEHYIFLLSGCHLETASWLGMGHRVNFLCSAGTPFDLWAHMYVSPVDLEGIVSLVSSILFWWRHPFRVSLYVYVWLWVSICSIYWLKLLWWWLSKILTYRIIMLWNFFKWLRALCFSLEMIFRRCSKQEDYGICSCFWVKTTIGTLLQCFRVMVAVGRQ